MDIFREKYIEDVQSESEYAPTPPPMLVYPNASIDLDPIIWRRRAPTRVLDLYQGGIGSQTESIQAEESSPTPVGPSVEISVPVLLPYIIRNDYEASALWVYSYLLKTLPVDISLFYLQKIHEEGAQYPDEIHYAIKTVLNRPKMLGRVSNSLSLYLPREIREDPLTFFYSSLYWLRQFRSIRSSLLPLLEQITWLDLYLVTSNPYELFPARKLLSYYRDDELYMRFGRIGNHYLSKEYHSKRSQLDSFVAMTLRHFGYVKVISWSRPVRLIYYPPDLSVAPSVGRKFQSDNTSQETNLQELLSRTDLHAMVILRLGIQLYASLPAIKDKNAWQPLIELLEHKAGSFYNQYLMYKTNLETYTTTREPVVVPIEDQSLEAPVDGRAQCQVCKVMRPIGDFSLCGHPICMLCQVLLKSAACPFCGEHFTADNLDVDFLGMINSPLEPAFSMQSAIRQVNDKIKDRVYKFDWSTLTLGLFGLK